MSSPSFSEQTAIVTGGASGLGLAIAQQLQARGVFVAAFDLDPTRCAALAAEFGARGTAVAVDVTDERAVRQAVDQIAQKRGRIDILVNSAGITGKTNIKTHEVDLEDFEKVMRINVRGPFLASKAV